MENTSKTINRTTVTCLVILKSTEQLNSKILQPMGSKVSVPEEYIPNPADQ